MAEEDDSWLLGDTSNKHEEDNLGWGKEDETVDPENLDEDNERWGDEPTETVNNGLVGKTAMSSKEIGEETLSMHQLTGGSVEHQADGTAQIKFPSGNVRHLTNHGNADMKKVYGTTNPISDLLPSTPEERHRRVTAKTILPQPAYRETPTQNEQPVFKAIADNNEHLYDSNPEIQVPGLDNNDPEIHVAGVQPPFKNGDNSNVHNPDKSTNILETPKTLEDAYQELLAEKKDYKPGETVRFNTSITRGIRSRHQAKTSVALTPEESELAKKVEETIATSEPARIEEDLPTHSIYKLTTGEKVRARYLLTSFLDEEQGMLNKILTSRVRTQGFGDERDTVINLESLINNPNRIAATVLRSKTDENFINYARGNIELRTDAGKNAMRNHIESAIEKNNPEQLTARLAYVGYAVYSRKIDDFAKEVTKDKWTGIGTRLSYINEMSLHPSTTHKLKVAEKASQENRKFFKQFIEELRELDLTTKDGAEQAYGFYKRRALSIRESPATKTGLLTGQVNLVAYIMHERRRQMRDAGIPVVGDNPQNRIKKSQPTIDVAIDPSKMAESEARALAKKPRRARPLAIMGLISAIGVAGLAWSFQEQMKPFYQKVGATLYNITASEDSPILHGIGATPTTTIQPTVSMQPQKEDPRIKEFTIALDEERQRSEALYQQFSDDLNNALTNTEDQGDDIRNLRETILDEVDKMRADMNQRVEDIYRRIEAVDLARPTESDAIIIPPQTPYEERVTQLEKRIKNTAQTVDTTLEIIEQLKKVSEQRFNETTTRLDTIEDREIPTPAELQEVRDELYDLQIGLEHNVIGLEQDVTDLSARLKKVNEKVNEQQNKYATLKMLEPIIDPEEGLPVEEYREPTTQVTIPIPAPLKRHTLHPGSFDPIILYKLETTYMPGTAQRIKTHLTESPLEISLTIPGLLTGTSDDAQVKQQVAEVVLYTAYHESHNQNGADPSVQAKIMASVEKKRSAASTYLSRREMTVLNEQVAAIVRGNFAEYTSKKQ